MREDHRFRSCRRRGRGVGAAPMTPAGTPQTAIFAGGCFWSMQSAFEKVYGVIDAVSGYTGGTLAEPHLRQLRGARPRGGGAGDVGPQPRELRGRCWTPTGTTRTPPTAAGSSWTGGPSTGPSCIYMNDQQKAEAEASKAALAKSGKLPGPIVAQIVKAGAVLPGRGLPPGLPEEEPRQLHGSTTRTRAARSSSPRSGARPSSWIPAAPPMAVKAAWKKPSVGPAEEDAQPACSSR